MNNLVPFASLKQGETEDLSYIVEIENVSHGYSKDESQLVLENLSLKVSKGEFLVVLGHNGSGKSTLAKLINGILVPRQGSVRVNGMDTNDEELIWDIRQTAGMVFQNPDNQLVATVVEEDVAFGPENQGVESSEIRRRVDAALKTVEMYEYRKNAPHMLSGGQKQRVAIAGVLAMKPDCIILDEPTAMLDPSGRNEVISTVKRLNREEGKTIIHITHYMDEAIDADRIVVMASGKIAMEGTPREVFGDVEKIRSLGLDVPQVTELAFELKKAGIDLDPRVLRIEELVKRI